MTAPYAGEVARAALRWVRGHRDDFALPADVTDPRTPVDRTLKPLGELAQLCLSIRRATPPGDERHRVAAELVDFAWRQTDGGALFLDLLRAEPFATYPLEIYAAFAEAGLRHPEFERLAGAVLRTRNWRATEQDPNRRLGILNTERRSGFPRTADPAEALERTWLGALPEPWSFERPSGYALTHTVFHLTNWGAAPHAVPDDLARYLGTWLPAWTDGCLEDQQWDLGCELLAVAASLPEPSDPPPETAGAARESDESVWARIAEAQDEHGGLPEVGGRPRDFIHCYHSTLVAAFAATLTTERTAPPPRTAPLTTEPLDGART
ncbi:hypothetical protein ABZ832_14315 [Streptantibioticus parmotrematis]|uniref:DUF6895 family protein n=1 Tax=Streptantibioticus parmotrematis TaxID=2873249 RepID=UPI0033D15A32